MAEYIKKKDLKIMAEYIKKKDLLNESYWQGDRYTVQNPYPSGVEAVDVEDIEKMETIDIVKCGECKHFELNPITVIDGIPLILAHEICHFWGMVVKHPRMVFVFTVRERRVLMRLIDADELIEHVWRDRLDSRERIAKLVESMPTIKAIPVAEIYDAGYKGKEVQFRIGGRLFAVRELAQ